MCLSTQAFVLFLAMLPQDIVDQTGERVVINATAGQALWLPVEDNWCTTAPQAEHFG